MFNSLVWLFLMDFFHQVLFYFGTVVAMAILIYEKNNDKPVHRNWVAGIFVVCCFVSCFQVFVDEHRNSEQLISDKNQIYRQEEFWRDQSLSKDADLRNANGRLTENFETLTSTTKTANDTQRSLTKLASKLVDLNKASIPPQLNLTLSMEIFEGAALRLGIPVGVAIFVIPNREVPSPRVLIRCNHSIDMTGGGYIVGGGGTMWSPSDPRRNRDSFLISIVTPSLTPEHALFVPIRYTPNYDGEKIGCSVTPQ